MNGAGVVRLNRKLHVVEWIGELIDLEVSKV